MNEQQPQRRGLLAELRRRRVFRTLALYVVAAWVLMQVADVLFPAWGIPDSAIRLLLLAAVAGFPVALVFAWLFDITPEGIRRTRHASEDDSQGVEPLGASDYLVLGALVMVLGLIIYGTVGGVVDVPEDFAQPATTRDARGDGPPMVGVLPFTFRGAGDDAEFFASGVHDDLLTRLAQIASLRVISRTSVLDYQGTTKRIPEIGRELNADAILEGGVQVAGGQIRINAQLIDARTDEHLWAETFDRELTAANIFEVQGEIARAIAASMQAALSPQEVSSLEVLPTSNLAAYRAFHSAMRELEAPERTDRERVEQLLQQAIDLDPGFTRAMAELGGQVALRNFRRKNDTDIARIEELISRIGAQAPNSADHLTAQAFYTYYVVRDYDSADRLITLAREAAPSYLRLVHIQSWIKKRAGDLEAWLELTRLGRRLDPADPDWTEMLVYRLQLMHRDEEALAEALAVEQPSVRLRAATSQMQFAQHGDTERYLAELEAIAAEEDDSYVVSLLWELHLLRRDFPAVHAIVEDMRLAERDLTPTVDSIPQGLTLALLTQIMQDDDARLAQLRREAEMLLGVDGEDGEERLAKLFVTNRILLATAARDDAAALRALDELAAMARDDLAVDLQMNSQLCGGLGMAGQASRAATCLRRASERPSDIKPYIEPLLPFYDRVRDHPDFQTLLRDFAEKGWLEI